MGFGTDWFIADAQDATAIAEVATTPALSFDKWPKLWMKGVGELELVHLWNMLGQGTYQLGAVAGELVFKHSEEGPFITCVPLDFITALARIPENRIANLAIAWQSLEPLAEWQHWDAEKALGDLVSFAQQALGQDKSVLELIIV